MSVTSLGVLHPVTQRRTFKTKIRFLASYQNKTFDCLNSQ